MFETVISLAALIGILVVSAVITNWFTRAMYNRCEHCGALNAKRRVQCRMCHHELLRG
jgi:hypothetical protein